MRKNHILLLIPFLALVSSQKQKEITLEQAKEIVTKIRNNDDYSRYILYLNNKGDIGKGNDKISVDLVYCLKQGLNAYYTSLKGTDGRSKYDIEMYCVTGTKYGDVKYIKYYDEKQKDYIKQVATSKYDEDYETAFQDLGAYRTRSVLDYYLQVGEFAETTDEGDTYKYYSSKDGDLTIKCSTSLKVKDTDAEEKVTKGESVYVYENYRLKSINSKTSSSYGNKWDTRGRMDFDTKFSVQLPNGWESYVKAKA